MCSLVKSAGVVIGWNENLHTLGPPWHIIGHHWPTLSGEKKKKHFIVQL